MKIEKARQMAVELIMQHLGDGWRFDFDRSKRRFGCCHGNSKLITLSRELVELNDEDEVKDTILHEIAHGLAGAKAHHNYLWKYWCRQIGARPERCYSIARVSQPKPKYLLICPNCGRVRKAYKRRDCSCGRCSGAVYNPKYKMKIEVYDDSMEYMLEPTYNAKIGYTAGGC